MTREFCELLKQEFPDEKYRFWQYNYEQFGVSMLGKGFVRPTLKGIGEIARTELKRVNSIYVADGDYLQGTDKGDIIIIPGYQVRSKHALAITDMDSNGDGRSILFSTSWHAPYRMTPGQMDRYIQFAQTFFRTFGANCSAPL